MSRLALKPNHLKNISTLVLAGQADMFYPEV